MKGNLFNGKSTILITSVTKYSLFKISFHMCIIGLFYIRLSKNKNKYKTILKILQWASVTVGGASDS